MVDLIEKIATRYLEGFKIWREKRLYVYATPKTKIYNSKKCRQTVYIDLADFSVHCYTECPDQYPNWLHNENTRVINALKPLARLLRIATGYSRGLSSQSVEMVLHNAALDMEPVQGYVTEWRQVRVKINGFGKLALRNRQFVLPYNGTKGDAPRGFVPLSKPAFDLLLQMADADGLMLEPYAPVPDFERNISSLQ
jgi:hypothetical protein